MNLQGSGGEMETMGHTKQAYKHLAAWYYQAAAVALENKDARPILFYHMGAFHFYPGDSGDRKAAISERAQVVINTEGLKDLTTGYQPATATYLIQKILEDFITEREIFGLF